MFDKDAKNPWEVTLRGIEGIEDTYILKNSTSNGVPYTTCHPGLFCNL